MADLDGEEKARKIAEREVGNVVEVWDIRGEQWRKIALCEIGEIERLTGQGVKTNDDEVDLEGFLNEVAFSENEND
jgi:hypothetical protein